MTERKICSRFIYTDKLRIKTATEFSHVLHVSDYYQLPRMCETAYKLLPRLLKTSNACDLFEVCVLSKKREFAQQCLEFIQANAKESFNQGRLNTIQLPTLICLLKVDHEFVTEVELFMYCVAWAKHKIAKRRDGQQRASSSAAVAEDDRQAFADEIRRELGSALNHIRFFAMSYSEFTKVMQEYPVLSPVEQLDIYRFPASGDATEKTNKHSPMPLISDHSWLVQLEERPASHELVSVSFDWKLFETRVNVYFPDHLHLPDVTHFLIAVPSTNSFQVDDVMDIQVASVKRMQRSRSLRYVEIATMENITRDDCKRSKIDTGDVVLYATVPLKKPQSYCRSGPVRSTVKSYKISVRVQRGAKPRSRSNKRLLHHTSDYKLVKGTNIITIERDDADMFTCSVLPDESANYESSDDDAYDVAAPTAAVQADSDMTGDGSADDVNDDEQMPNNAAPLLLLGFQASQQNC